eukprot:9492577-Pyramimonas_sp.AAC.1
MLDAEGRCGWWQPMPKGPLPSGSAVGWVAVPPRLVLPPKCRVRRPFVPSFLLGPPPPPGSARGLR